VSTLDIILSIGQTLTLESSAVIEQYFIGQYSISQRYTILSSLALAARELAVLPVPPPLPATPSQPIAPATIDLFPSKRLPPNLHRRFIGSNAVEPKGAETIDAMTSSLTDASLSDARSTAEESIPEAARESLLSLRSKRPASRSLAKPAPAKANFSALSSAFFLSPLINYFWSSLQSSSLSPSASSLALLHPIVLSKYLNTLTILLHASVLSLDLHRSSIPSTLELLFSLRSPSDSSDPVLTTASMELLLQIVQLSMAHDSGRELMRDENGWVGQVREWAAEVFEETQGEGRGGRGAAGVLLGCESVEDGWRRG
jgi:telomere length regulation protein